MRKIVAFTLLAAALATAAAPARAADLTVVSNNEAARRILMVIDFIAKYDRAAYTVTVNKGLVSAADSTGKTVKTVTLLGGKYTKVDGAKNDKFTPPSRLSRFAWVVRVNAVLKLKQGAVLTNQGVVKEFISQYDMPGFTITSDGKSLTATAKDGTVVETVNLNDGRYRKVDGTDNDQYTPPTINTEDIISHTA